VKTDDWIGAALTQDEIDTLRKELTNLVEEVGGKVCLVPMALRHVPNTGAGLRSVRGEGAGSSISVAITITSSKYIANARGSSSRCRKRRRWQVQLPRLDSICSVPTVTLLRRLLGVLTRGALDDGRGKARVGLFRHKHEMETGRTSSVGMEVSLTCIAIGCPDSCLHLRFLASPHPGSRSYPTHRPRRTLMLFAATSWVGRQSRLTPLRSYLSSVARPSPPTSHQTLTRTFRPRWARTISEDDALRTDFRRSLLRLPDCWRQCWPHRHVQGASRHCTGFERACRCLHH
jgi:hypothetical protein